MSVRVYPDGPRIYVDMDGVVADLKAECSARNIHPKHGKAIHGIYRNLPLIDGAKEGVAGLLNLGYFVMFLTKIPKENPSAATDKYLWAYTHFPNLKDYVIITPDKGCVGTPKDYLIDDHPEWANAHNFPGIIIPFGISPTKTWNDIFTFFDNTKHIHND